MMVGNKIRIKQIGSPIGRRKDQEETLIALGLNKIGRMREHIDNGSIRGMVNKVKHLVQVEAVK